MQTTGGEERAGGFGESSSSLCDASLSNCCCLIIWPCAVRIEV